MGEGQRTSFSLTSTSYHRKRWDALRFLKLYGSPNSKGRSTEAKDAGELNGEERGVPDSMKDESDESPLVDGPGHSTSMMASLHVICPVINSLTQEHSAGRM